jgi:hypothetical protein
VIATCEQQVGWDSEVWQRPDPTNFPAYYPDIPSPPSLKPHLQSKFGNTIVSAYIYGSVANHEAGPDSILDVLVISNSSQEFHQRGVIVSPKDYKTGHNPQFHSAVNHFGPSYYHTQMLVGESFRRAKYVVTDLSSFATYARGARRDSLQNGTGMGFFSIAGRIQKAMLIPIITGGESPEQQIIDASINQSRLDAAILSLGLLPTHFTYQQLAKTGAKLSYMADRRIEKNGKAQSLVDRNPFEYYQMYEGVLGELIRCGIINCEGGGEFSKNYSLSEQAVRSYLSESANFALLLNIPKNTLTCGFAFGYLKDKVVRAYKANHQ